VTVRRLIGSTFEKVMDRYEKKPLSLFRKRRSGAKNARKKKEAAAAARVYSLVFALWSMGG
jgi:hypothetical protein